MIFFTVIDMPIQWFISGSWLLSSVCSWVRFIGKENRIYFSFKYRREIVTFFWDPQNQSLNICWYYYKILVCLDCAFFVVVVMCLCSTSIFIISKFSKIIQKKNIWHPDEFISHKDWVTIYGNKQVSHSKLLTWIRNLAMRSTATGSILLK